VIKKFLK
jgi:hypothetical protein